MEWPARSTIASLPLLEGGDPIISLPQTIPRATTSDVTAAAIGTMDYTCPASAASDTEQVVWPMEVAEPADQVQGRPHRDEPLPEPAPQSDTHTSVLSQEAAAEAFPLLRHGWLRSGPRFPIGVDDAIAVSQPTVPTLAAVAAPAQVTECPLAVQQFGTEDVVIEQAWPAASASAASLHGLEPPARRLVAPTGNAPPRQPVGPVLAADGCPRLTDAVLLRMDDLPGVHHPLGRAVANALIKRFRSSGLVRQDLSNDEPVDSFKWKQYIRSMSGAMQEQVVGVGITRFCLEIIDGIPDSNTTNLDRVDFVVHRADGTSVRLHPHKSWDAQVCFVELPCTNPWYRGRLARHVGNYHGGLAVGSPSPSVRCTVAGLYKVTNLIGRKEARAFLTSLGQDAVIDLTDGVLFGWPRWLASFQQNDKVTVIGTGLTNITARPVMGSRWPSFVVTRADGTSVIIWPGPKLTIHECDVLPYSLPFSDRRR